METKTLSAKEYFESLEPDASRRRHLVETIRFAIQPRTDQKSIVLIQGPPRSGKTTLIKTMMKLLPDQSVKTYPDDVCRIWRAFEIRGTYPLRFVWLPTLDGRSLEDLPLLSGMPTPVLIGQGNVSPKFRYLVEGDIRDLDPLGHTKDSIITISLEGNFPEQDHLPPRVAESLSRESQLPRSGVASFGSHLPPKAESLSIESHLPPKAESLSIESHIIYINRKDLTNYFG